MSTEKPKHILIAPLDWGLGHTARCIPIISRIQSLGHIPVVAGNDSQKSFIEKSFEAIDFIHLDGYNITYSDNNKYLQAGLLSQLPHVSKAISAEHKWLLQLCTQRQIDGIISDNRYGLHHTTIPSVILTHQLEVQTSLGHLANRLVQKVHYRYLRNFRAIWVVDTAATPNLGGALSHTYTHGLNVTYIGLLSRFAEMPIQTVSAAENDAPLMVLLSGPEPQRTMLSNILWQQLQTYSGKVIFIEGNERAAKPEHISANVAWYGRLTHQELWGLLSKAGMVICRSGYSTLMDLVAMQKKAILIPTPAQTEQEYLGRHLNASCVLLSTPQHNFILGDALEKAKQFSYNFPQLGGAFTTHKQVVEDWIASL